MWSNRKFVCFMQWYMQMPAAVELVAVRGSEGQSQSQLAVSESTPLRATALSGLQMSNPDAEEELSGVL